MKRIIVFTGSGMSAESGIPTFCGMGGMWEKFDIKQLPSPEGWAANPGLVTRFYNERRKQLLECEPNAAHFSLVDLEKHFDVRIITQNIDDLHERSGSRQVLHLHGEMRKYRSTGPGAETFPIDGWELKTSDLCPKGYPLRPHVVWFGEAVEEMLRAQQITASADIMIIIGTSMQVYPAAGLVNCVRQGIPIYFIDPEPVNIAGVTSVQATAVVGMTRLRDILLAGI